MKCDKIILVKRYLWKVVAPKNHGKVALSIKLAIFHSTNNRSNQPGRYEPRLITLSGHLTNQLIIVMIVVRQCMM